MRLSALYFLLFIAAAVQASASDAVEHADPTSSHILSVASFYERPVPRLAPDAPTALSYHGIPIVHDKLYVEPLVDVSKLGIAGLDYYARTDGLNPPYRRALPGAVKAIYCRGSVAAKLSAVNRKLRPLGLEVCLYDAYRPVAVQRSLWTYFLEEARHSLNSTDEAAVRQHAGRFCSDPSAFAPNDESTYPTHTTGGAVDLTLRNKSSGELLFMGTIFDESSDAAYTDYFEHSNSASAEEARRNRRLLYWVMRSEGFANYPYEWWHFDWGNQMWVQNFSRESPVHSHASYGLPPVAH